MSKQLQSMLEAVLTGRIAPEAAARHAAGLIEAITGLPVVVGQPEHDGDRYVAVDAARAALVAETTATVPPLRRPHTPRQPTNA